MKLLNLGCGYPRIQGPEWVNIDNLKSQLTPGTPEYVDLCAERNYVEHNILEALPFPDNDFDGILASHVFEHFDCQEALRILLECRRVLRPGASLVISVPDASYFLRVYPEDRVSNWPRLFGVTDPGNTIPTFFEAALWFDQHKAILTRDALLCYILRAGFQTVEPRLQEGVARQWIAPHLNRREFSIEVEARKPY